MKLFQIISVAAITLWIISGVYFLGYANEETPRIESHFCFGDKKIWVMYNKERAEELGVSDDDIVYLTYAYLYNYSIWTEEHVADKFLEIPVEKCCYSIHEEGGKDYYCKEKY